MGWLPVTPILRYSQDGEDTRNFWKLGHQKVAGCHHPGVSLVSGQEMQLRSDCQWHVSRCTGSLNASDNVIHIVAHSS